MYNIDFKNPVKVYFIGIGGISMSGFAELLHSLKFDVTGSDRQKTGITDHLESIGIKVFGEQVAENITPDIDLVVYTAAIHPDNPEFDAAKKMGLPMMERAELVGQVMKNYKTAAAISGTHGKTTTTSMASHVFLKAGLDPTISVGGILPVIGGNIRIGNSSNFITEACEYTNSFLKFYPTIGIILNIEEDHMDFFHDIEDIRNSFRKFAELIPDDGSLIVNADIDDHEKLFAGLNCRVITYSIEGDANFTSKDIAYDECGHPSFDVYKDGSLLGRCTLAVPGLHNVGNALSCIALSSVCGVDFKTACDALTEFKGTNRRFEIKGKLNGFTIVDDYAHHPTEIKATIDAAKRYPHNELWIAFQPHTYTRTKAFLQDFADVLSEADHVILTDIYAAREPDPGDISSKDIADLLEKAGTDVTYLRSFDEIEKFILKNLVNDDLLITMGAGNIVDIGEHLLKS